MGKVGHESSLSAAENEQQMSRKSTAHDRNGFASPSSTENMCDMQDTPKESRKTSCAKLASHVCANQTGGFRVNHTKIDITRRNSEFYVTIANHDILFITHHTRAEITTGGRFLWARRKVLLRDVALCLPANQRVSESQLKTRKIEMLILWL